MVVDTRNKVVEHYEDVPKILKTLKNECFKNQSGYLSIASRTTEYNGAIQLLQLFDWHQYFDSIQIYPRCKIEHMERICTDLDIEKKEDILFFDDEKRNIYDTNSIGVHAHLINEDHGVNVKAIIDGLNMFNIARKCATLSTGLS